VIADAIAVAVFVTIGRAAHHHGLTAAGLASTAWPFAAGLAVGWLMVVRRGGDGVSLRAGLLVWLSTVAGGMLLRVVGGQGTAVAFIIVALAFLGLFVLGWRVALAALRRSRRPASLGA
jgi:hypothetical protein